MEGGYWDCVDKGNVDSVDNFHKQIVIHRMVGRWKTVMHTKKTGENEKKQ